MGPAVVMAVNDKGVPVNGASSTETTWRREEMDSLSESKNIHRESVGASPFCNVIFAK